MNIESDAEYPPTRALCSDGKILVTRSNSKTSVLPEKHTVWDTVTGKAKKTWDTPSE